MDEKPALSLTNGWLPWKWFLAALAVALFLGGTAAAAPDCEPQSDLRDRLTSNVYIDEENVEVAVEDGFVTLTGAVDRWRERRMVVEQAYLAGARVVKNRLRVRTGPEYYRPDTQSGGSS
jgi:hypothetical protein